MALASVAWGYAHCSQTEKHMRTAGEGYLPARFVSAWWSTPLSALHTHTHSSTPQSIHIDPAIHAYTHTHMRSLVYLSVYPSRSISLPSDLAIYPSIYLPGSSLDIYVASLSISLLPPPTTVIMTFLSKSMVIMI